MEDIRQIYLDSSFTNVMTSIEFREKVSEGKDVNITVMDKLEAENPQISTIMNAYYDNFGRFIKTIDSGLLDMTLDELNEKQKQAGIEKVIELIKSNERVTNRARTDSLGNVLSLDGKLLPIC